MTNRFHSLLAVAMAGAVLAACADSTAPSQSRTIQPLLASGSGGGGTGGGGTGGGGTGGGGGGTGGGGGATTVGRVQATGGTATCDAGSTYSASLSRGFQERANVVVTAIASPIPTGPAVPPSPFPSTSLGGYTTFTMTNDATGTILYGQAGTMGLSTPSFTETMLTTTFPKGVTPVRMVWQNQQLAGLSIPPNLATIPIHETCVLVLNVTAL